MTTIEILSELRSNYNCFDEQEESVYRALSEAIKAVSVQPERKTGRWIKKEERVYYWYECSECGAKPLWNEWRTDRCFSAFCPNCGAKMEVEHEHNTNKDAANA